MVLIQARLRLSPRVDIAYSRLLCIWCPSDGVLSGVQGFKRLRMEVSHASNQGRIRW